MGKRTCKALHRLKSSIIKIALEVFKKNFLSDLQHVIRCQHIMRGDNAHRELKASKMRLLLTVTGSNKRLIEQKNKEEEKMNKGEEMKNKEGDKRNMNKECKRNNREETKNSKEEIKNNKEEEKSKSAKMKSIEDTLNCSNHASSALHHR